MPHNLYDWHDRIKAVEREYRALRSAVGRMRRAIIDGAEGPVNTTVGDLLTANENLEGTYLIRLWAEFETAVRSYYAWLIHDADNRIGTHDPDQHCGWRPSWSGRLRGRASRTSMPSGITATR